MSDYQAIFDAVRSRVSSCDTHSAIVAALRESCDFSFAAQLAQQEIGCVGMEMTSPHVLMRPDVFLDGNAWCALYGPDIQVGVCGFGATPTEACTAFDKAWRGETP